MAKNWKVTTIRVVVERFKAYCDAAVRDGFTRGYGDDANVGGWLKNLADRRVEDLRIEADAPPPPPPPRSTHRRVRAERVPATLVPPPPPPERPVPATVDGGLPPPVAPDCWHVPVGTFCKRCGATRRS